MCYFGAGIGKLQNLSKSVFVNKILFERSHTRSSTDFLWLLLHCNGRDEWLQQRPYLSDFL